MVGIISVVIGGHFGGGDHLDGGDHFGGGTYPGEMDMQNFEGHKVYYANGKKAGNFSQRCALSLVWA